VGIFCTIREGNGILTNTLSKLRTGTNIPPTGRLSLFTQFIKGRWNEQDQVLTEQFRGNILSRVLALRWRESLINNKVFKHCLWMMKEPRVVFL
jgi:hypothetical protein